MAFVCRPARDPFPALIGIVVVAFACWTVFCHLLVFTGASFATLLRWCDVPVGLALALGALLSRGTQETRWEPPGAAPAAPSVGSCSLRLCVAALIVLAYWLTDSYLLFWIAAMSFVAVTVFLEQRVGGWAPQWGP